MDISVKTISYSSCVLLSGVATTQRRMRFWVTGQQRLGNTACYNAILPKFSSKSCRYSLAYKICRGLFRRFAFSRSVLLPLSSTQTAVNILFQSILCMPLFMRGIQHSIVPGNSLKRLSASRYVSPEAVRNTSDGNRKPVLTDERHFHRRTGHCGKTRRHYDCARLRPMASRIDWLLVVSWWPHVRAAPIGLTIVQRRRRANERCCHLSRRRFCLRWDVLGPKQMPHSVTVRMFRHTNICCAWGGAKNEICVFQKRAPFLFLRLLCVLFTDLKYVWQYCSKGNLQQNTHLKFYVDEWCLIVTQAENTPSTATVDIDVTQQNTTLKLVTQLEINAKPSKRRSDQVFKMSSASFYTSSSVKNKKSTADSWKQHSAVFVREFGATHSLQQWVLRTTLLQAFEL